MSSPPRRADHPERYGAAGVEAKIRVCARHGWPYWRALSFFGIILAGCVWALAMLVLYPAADTANGYRIVLVIALPFAAIHLGLALTLRADRVLEADQQGIRLYQGNRLRQSFEWGQVCDMQIGYLAVGSKYHGRLQKGYRIRAVGRSGDGRISIDSIKFDIPTDDLVQFAERASVVAESHAVRVSRDVANKHP